MALGKVNENIFSVNHYNKIFKDFCNDRMKVILMRIYKTWVYFDLQRKGTDANKTDLKYKRWKKTVNLLTCIWDAVINFTF